MAHIRFISTLLLLALLAAACAPAPPPAPPATAAAPAHTPVPATETPVPTATPTPEPPATSTPTPAPTSTPTPPPTETPTPTPTETPAAAVELRQTGDTIFYIDENGEQHNAPTLEGYTAEAVIVDEAIIDRFPEFFAQRAETLMGEAIVLYIRQNKVEAILWPDIVSTIEADGAMTEHRDALAFTPAALRRLGLANPRMTDIVLPLDITTDMTPEIMRLSGMHTKTREDKRLFLQNLKIYNSPQNRENIVMGIPIGSAIVMPAEHTLNGTMTVHIRDYKNRATKMDIGHEDRFVADYIKGDDKELYVRVLQRLHQKEKDQFFPAHLGQRLTTIYKIHTPGDDYYTLTNDNWGKLHLPRYNANFYFHGYLEKADGTHVFNPNLDDLLNYDETNTIPMILTE